MKTSTILRTALAVAVVCAALVGINSNVYAAATTFHVQQYGAESRLQSEITAAAVTLVVKSGEGAYFPSSYPYYLVIGGDDVRGGEVVACTNRSTDTFTVTRAQLSTSAVAHVANSTVRLAVISGSVAELQTAVNAIETVWNDVTASAAELNILDNATLTTAELNKLAGVTAGTNTASKALVAGATNNLDYLRLGYAALTKTDVEPGTTEGMLYADDSENLPKYYTGSAWVALAVGTGVGTLDQSYDYGAPGGGRTITADTGAVVITNTDADAAPLLSITPTPSGSAAQIGIQITSGANCTDDSLQIVNSGTGDDIQAGAGAFKVSKLGAVNALSAALSAGATVGTSLTVGTTLGVTGLATLSSGLALDNGETITNAVNDAYKYTGGTEDYSVTFGSNSLSLSSSSGVDTLAFGTIDALTGLESLAFDAAAATITLTADGAADDLTISTAGAQDTHLVISAAGTTADAMQIITTGGGLDITNGGAAAHEDIDIVSTNASINFTAAENVADASVWTLGGGIQFNITGAATQDFVVANTGGSAKFTVTEAAADSFQIIASGGVDVDCVDDLILTCASTTTADDILIQQTGAVNASIILSAAGTGADAIALQSLAGGLDIDAKDDINITCASTTTADDFNIIQTGAVDASIHVEAAGTGADAIALQSLAGGLDIDAKDDIIITCASTTAADDILIQQTGAQNASIILSAAGTGVDAIALQSLAGGLDVDCKDDMILTCASTTDADDVRIIQTGANNSSISLEAAGTGTDAIRLQSPAGGLDIDAKDDINITLASNAGADDFIIALTGANDASILVQSAGTGEDAIGLASSAGGVTISAGTDINVASDLDMGASADVIGDGSGKIGGMLVNMLNDIDGQTVTIAQSGYVCTNTTDGDGQAWVLPEASTAIGMQYTFVVTAAFACTVDPDNGDTILLATDAAGDKVSCATVGSSITLTALNASSWAVTSIYGTWTDAN